MHVLATGSVATWHLIVEVDNSADKWLVGVQPGEYIHCQLVHSAVVLLYSSLPVAAYVGYQFMLGHDE